MLWKYFANNESQFQCAQGQQKQVMQSLLRWQREGSILLAQQVWILISDFKNERPFSITGFLARTSTVCCFAAAECSFVCRDSLCIQSALSVKVIVGKMMQDETLRCFNSHLISFQKAVMCTIGSLSQAFWNFSICFNMGAIGHAYLKYFRHLEVIKMNTAIPCKCTMVAFEIKS